MEKLFIVKESGEEIARVEAFIGESGRVVSITPGHVSTATSTRAGGRWLVVADNGKGLELR